LQSVCPEARNMGDSGENEPTRLGKPSDDLGGTEDDTPEFKVVNMFWESKGIFLVLVAAILEAIGTYLPLFSSRVNSFSVLDYKVISRILAPLFTLNAMLLFIVCFVTFLLLAMLRRTQFIHRSLDSAHQRCCSYPCCCLVTLAVLACLFALAFVVIMPVSMPIIFGGPNELGDDLEYDLDAGYFLTSISKLAAVAGLSLCVHEHRRRVARASVVDNVYRPRDVIICMVALASGMLLSLSWIVYILNYVYSGSCSGVDVETITLPTGFSMSLFANIPGARSITQADDDFIIVSTRKEGTVHAIHLDSKSVKTIFTGGDQPNGIAFRDRFLYIVDISCVLRYAWSDVLKSVDSGEPLTTHGGTKIADLPTDTHHGWRYARFGPDGLLYIAVGAPCNICNEKEFASITALNVTSFTRTVVAKGVRNSVGFDFAEATGNLWFTENGGDWLGDDSPPDELNEVRDMHASPPHHFGFPHCYGRSGISYGEKFNPTGDCTGYKAAAVELGPHVAALGMRFYPSNLPAKSASLFPSGYHGKIFIAEHGSWNRREPIGYRVTISDGFSYEEFASGFLDGNGATCGRPVDLEILADGSMLISDDESGSLFRVEYRSP